MRPKTPAEREAARARETLVPCPKCRGKGFHMVTVRVLATGPTYRRQDCDLCGKTGSVPATTARAWKAGQENAKKEKSP